MPIKSIEPIEDFLKTELGQELLARHRFNLIVSGPVGRRIFNLHDTEAPWEHRATFSTQQKRTAATYVARRYKKRVAAFLEELNRIHRQ